jgi:hypothetical protein
LCSFTWSVFAASPGRQSEVEAMLLSLTHSDENLERSIAGAREGVRGA